MANSENINYTGLQNIIAFTDPEATPPITGFPTYWTDPLGDKSNDIYFEIPSGYVLDGNIRCTYRENGGAVQSFNATQITSYLPRVVYKLDVYNRFRYGTHSADTITAITITGQAVAQVEPMNDYPMLRAYKVDKTIMSQLANTRFIQPQTNNYVDLAQYILSLTRYPFNVETESNSDVIFGYYDTNVNSPLVKAQKAVISLGKKLIKGVYENSSDISKCNIKLYLPYYNMYNLDNKYINTEIEIIYKVDLMSNNCVIEIYSNDNLIDTVNCVIGYDVPFIQNINNPIILNKQVNSNILRDKIGFALVEQKEKINGVYYDTLINTTLELITGYVRCKDIHLENNKQMTTDEIRLIKNYLTSGVIIKEVTP